ncbi:hypothetical protein [Phyllobacterium calauticae]|jgi:hypothetical protein|uniref:hypothetical protein n=1 Tax=Phyllobacterium calauticae TaxID=2817027 RepID=UPI001CBA9180|nr:hypothetical protein [Phyllobacterium calauticae]MBZ3691023.1 hypothetical protein [Phyllobacterium calauticae]
MTRTYKIINMDTGEAFGSVIFSKRTAEDCAIDLHEHNGHSYVVIETETRTVFRTPETRAA